MVKLFVQIQMFKKILDVIRKVGYGLRNEKLIHFCNNFFYERGVFTQLPGAPIF